MNNVHRQREISLMTDAEASHGVPRKVDGASSSRGKQPLVGPEPRVQVHARGGPKVLDYVVQTYLEGSATWLAPHGQHDSSGAISLDPCTSELREWD